MSYILLFFLSTLQDKLCLGMGPVCIWNHTFRLNHLTRNCDGWQHLATDIKQGALKLIASLIASLDCYSRLLMLYIYVYGTCEYIYGDEMTTDDGSVKLHGIRCEVVIMPQYSYNAATKIEWK